TAKSLQRTELVVGGQRSRRKIFCATARIVEVTPFVASTSAMCSRAVLMPVRFDHRLGADVIFVDPPLASVNPKDVIGGAGVSAVNVREVGGGQRTAARVCMKVARYRLLRRRLVGVIAGSVILVPRSEFDDREVINLLGARRFARQRRAGAQHRVVWATRGGCRGRRAVDNIQYH